jgi:hypothetical protein
VPKAPVYWEISLVAGQQKGKFQNFGRPRTPAFVVEWKPGGDSSRSFMEKHKTSERNFLLFFVFLPLAFHAFRYYYAGMDLEITYRGKTATTDDIAFINRLIAENPEDSRRALSQKLCRAWNWVQPNGALRDMVCRGFMLETPPGRPYKSAGEKAHPQQPVCKRKKPDRITG